MHLAGDPGTFLGRGQCPGLLTFAFQPPGPVAQLTEIRPAGVYVPAYEQASGREPGGV